jgi:protein TonB
MLLPLLLSIALIPAPSENSLKRPEQDSLPALHTLRDEDISAVSSSFEDHTINVSMKDGKVYEYLWKDWDTEDAIPGTSERVKKAIHDISVTYTKAERMPDYPGGDEAWQQYIDRFCETHKKDIHKAGSCEVLVQFIVHLKGQLTEVYTSGHVENAKQAALALQAIRESQPWTPAVQNGRTVVCLQKTWVVLK